MKKKKNIAIFSTGQGHQSIAEAIVEAIGEDANVEIFFDKGEATLFNYYMFVYKFLPFLNYIPYKILKNDLLKNISEIFIKNLYKEKIAEFIKNKKPDVIINNFWMFRPAIDDFLKNNKQQTYINIITDTWSAHPFIISNIADVNFAFDKKTIDAINPHHKKANTKSIGWFIRSGFEKRFNKQELRNKLKLQSNKPTFLFTSGSEGTEHILPLIKKICETTNPVQLVISCGKNENLLEKVNEIKKENNKTNITIEGIPFTNQLHLYMQAADLIIGKAGPNSVFEAVATLTPFFAITHINGQEDGNLEIINKLNIGYVEENLTKDGKKLLEILANIQELESFSEPLKKLATYNNQAKKELRNFLKENSII